jgi:2-oxoglutarate ferredoxin oxidoreductase subunit delta
LAGVKEDVLKKGKITIREDLCKECLLCIEFCAMKGILPGEEFNDRGFRPVREVDGACNGCAMCAVICPEAAIEVYRE